MAGRSAVQAFDRGRRGQWPPPKPKPLQPIDFRSLALRDRMRSLRCFENLRCASCLRLLGHTPGGSIRQDDCESFRITTNLRVSAAPKGNGPRSSIANNVLTRATNFDTLRKFAQNTVARPVSQTRKPHSVNTAHEVRGHKAVALPGVGP